MKIEIENLRYTYPGSVEALRGVSLNIESGEQVAIVGQNGAGKTTLLRHLNGLLQPTQGVVRIGDWDTRRHSVAKLATRVGYVFQNPDDQLFCRTVQEEVSFGPGNLSMDHDRKERLVKEAIALTDLTGKETINPYDLSPAWRKIVALASILAMDTPIVLLDEPTTGQDAANIARIAHIARSLRAQGKTVIAISHDIDFCAENFDRIIAMANGAILLDGEPQDVLAQEETLATTYVDPPQLTRLGRRLNLAETVYTEDQFLDSYRRLVNSPYTTKDR
ncbi:MAG: ABC transporter ATP-binding protein [Chloroflexi bacterium]|nr:ABC transporter ATP-binding protein [Chloroflexota bacterium]